jgi:hypothetical protein
VLAVSEEDYDRVVGIIVDLGNAYLPARRSTSFERGGNDLFRRKLGEQGIPFEVRNYADSEWIIWAEAHDERVRSLLQETQEELASAGPDE